MIFHTSFFAQELLTLTKQEKQAILDRHNYFRNEVDTDSLKWSEELADFSKEWALYLAKKKQFKHKPNNHYGENLFIISYKTTDGTLAVNDWASEKQYMNKRTKISNSNVFKIGHYTQIVWYNTEEVGCAVAVDKNGYSYWVCTYNPGGNYLGESPFGN
jgi:uncharacterized protein YkwD